MTDPTVTDLRRELEKARLALADAQSHLSAHAQMNAALHCATDVFYSPLHAKVTAAIASIEHALARTQDTAITVPAHSDAHCPWFYLLADFDRCVHGRHQGDACGDSCGYESQGNPHLRPGNTIGYGLRGYRIVMPDRDHKDDLAAWRPDSKLRRTR